MVQSKCPRTELSIRAEEADETSCLGKLDLGTKHNMRDRSRLRRQRIFKSIQPRGEVIGLRQGGVIWWCYGIDSLRISAEGVEAE